LLENVASKRNEWPWWLRQQQQEKWLATFDACKAWWQPDWPDAWMLDAGLLKSVGLMAVCD
jgi:hypothetical protein